MKKKICLLIICFILLIAMFIRNVVIKVNYTATTETLNYAKDDEGQEVKTAVLRKEAFRIMSYLFYTDDERNNLKNQYSLQDCDTASGDYPYINAILTEGFTNQLDVANEKNYIRPNDILNVYEMKLLVQKMAEKFQLEEKEIYQGAGVDYSSVKETQAVEKTDFIEIYEMIVLQIQSEAVFANKVTINQLYVLGVDDDNMFQTQYGVYKTNGMKLYSTTMENNGTDLSGFIDKKLEVISSDKHIIYIKDILEEETVVKNVYIIHGESNEINVFAENMIKAYPLKATLSEPINNTIGNITLKDGTVTGISIKPDSISDKVLMANNEYIELENYGKVSYDDNFKIYKVYDDLSMETTNSILIGYSNTQFVLTEDKISAAIITEPIKATNIRVLLSTDNNQKYYHKKITVTSDTAFSIAYGDEVKNYKAKKEVSIETDSKYLKEGRLKITADKEAGKLKVTTLKHSGTNPSYRGSLEIVSTENGLLLINELPIEEYLYAVLPSEMPTSYGLEALKVQAVCARSYAYRHIIENELGEYGAHVDDSVGYQVYNKIAENEDTKKAVNETYGQVITYQDDVIVAYYFSTSCGYTSSMSDVWTSQSEMPYLQGQLQVVKEYSEENKEGSGEDTVQTFSTASSINLSDDTAFREFLTTDSKTLDSEYPWYRWNVSISYDNLKKIIDERLESRYEANPNLILTQVGEDNYIAAPISTIGQVKKLEVVQRKDSGIITALKLVGSKATILVKTEYNIRMLLAPLYNEVERKDNSRITDLTLLPSAFFVFEEVDDAGSGNKGIKIEGGGYGHGVGMSQNGVKTMVDLGYNYEDIVAHYYNGTKLDVIYD